MKLHYYCFTFYDVIGSETAHASTYIGFQTPQVGLKDIAKAKISATVSAGATLLACSYLGHMTSEEFRG